MNKELFERMDGLVLLKEYNELLNLVLIRRTIANLEAKSSELTKNRLTGTIIQDLVKNENFEERDVRQFLNTKLLQDIKIKEDGKIFLGDYYTKSPFTKLSIIKDLIDQLGAELWELNGSGDDEISQICGYANERLDELVLNGHIKD